MSPDENALLSALFARVRAADTTARDPEAERLVDQSVRAQSSAPYYLAQAVIVQEQGLKAAAARIEELEAHVSRLESGDQQPAHQSGGFLGSMFGSTERAPWQAAPHASVPRTGAWDARPRDMPVPEARQAQSDSGPWDRQQPAPSSSGGFLRGAVGAAAGVAGGMLLAHSLSGIFGNHMSSLGLGSTLPTGNLVEETVINNYYGDGSATPAADEAVPQDGDGWQQADLDTSGDGGFDGGYDNDDTMDV